MKLIFPPSNYNPGILTTSAAPKRFATKRFVAPDSGELQGGFLPIAQPTVGSQLRQRSHWTLFRR